MQIPPKEVRLPEGTASSIVMVKQHSGTTNRLGLAPSLVNSQWLLSTCTAQVVVTELSWNPFVHEFPHNLHQPSNWFIYIHILYLARMLSKTNSITTPLAYFYVIIEHIRTPAECCHAQNICNHSKIKVHGHHSQTEAHCALSHNCTRVGKTPSNTYVRKAGADLPGKPTIFHDHLWESQVFLASFSHLQAGMPPKILLATCNSLTNIHRSRDPYSLPCKKSCQVHHAAGCVFLKMTIDQQRQLPFAKVFARWQNMKK